MKKKTIYRQKDPQLLRSEKIIETEGPSKTVEKTD